MKILNAQSGHNAAGTPLSYNGYVVCQSCGKEVQGISKETTIEFAYCLPCRHLKQPKEDAMPAVPKPSQAAEKKTTPKRVHKPALKAVKPVKEKKPHAEKRIGEAHPVPMRGKSAVWLAEIKEAGSVTKQELIDGCEQHGLSATMHGAMAYYCRHLGLLKD